MHSLGKENMGIDDKLRSFITVEHGFNNSIVLIERAGEGDLSLHQAEASFTGGSMGHQIHEGEVVFRDGYRFAAVNKIDQLREFRFCLRNIDYHG